MGRKTEINRVEALEYARENGVSIGATEKKVTNKYTLKSIRVGAAYIEWVSTYGGAACWRLVTSQGTYHIGYVGEAIKAAVDYHVLGTLPSVSRRVM